MINNSPPPSQIHLMTTYVRPVEEIQVSTNNTTPLSVQSLQPTIKPEELRDRLIQVKNANNPSSSAAVASSERIDGDNGDDEDMLDIEETIQKEQNDGHESSHEVEGK